MEDIYEKYKVKAITTIAYNGEKTCVCFYSILLFLVLTFLYICLFDLLLLHTKSIIYSMYCIEDPSILSFIYIDYIYSGFKAAFRHIAF